MLFADLSGYTAVAERMDPEAVKPLVDRTLRRLGEEIERFGGSIDKYIGDNVMGSSARRSPTRTTPSGRCAPASRCRRRWTVPIARADEKYGVGFSLRVGINSGEVMAGAVGDRYTVIGDAVNVAARLRPPAAGERHGRRVDLPGQPEAISYERLEPLT